MGGKLVGSGGGGGGRFVGNGGGGGSVLVVGMCDFADADI